MLFDIHTTQAAMKTLYRLTGIPIAQWRKNQIHEREFELLDDYVAMMVKDYGAFYLPQRYTELDFVYFHITTSANKCESIRKHGIVDLQKTYCCADSELRQFLDAHDVRIDLEEAILYHKRINYNIGYRSRPRDQRSIEYKCWSVGQRFYDDYSTCGFLSVLNKSAYGGQVHRRPEILSDLDALLATNLSLAWEMTHHPYEIVAKVNGHNIINLDFDELSDTDKIMRYVVMAYDVALHGGSENIVVLKRGISISPKDILEITSLSI